MEVEVVHVRSYGKTNYKVDHETLYVYCGRPGRLGNPYPMKKESERDKVVELYRNTPSSKEVVQEFKT